MSGSETRPVQHSLSMLIALLLSTSVPGERRNRAGQADNAAIEAQMKGCLLRWLTMADKADQIAPRRLLGSDKAP